MKLKIKPRILNAPLKVRDEATFYNVEHAGKEKALRDDTNGKVSYTSMKHGIPQSSLLKFLH